MKRSDPSQRQTFGSPYQDSAQNLRSNSEINYQSISSKYLRLQESNERLQKLVSKFDGDSERRMNSIYSSMQHHSMARKATPSTRQRTTLPTQKNFVAGNKFDAFDPYRLVNKPPAERSGALPRKTGLFQGLQRLG